MNKVNVGINHILLKKKTNPEQTTDLNVKQKLSKSQKIT